MIQNLAINEMVRSQAQRNWLTEQLGYEIPLLLVISKWLRDNAKPQDLGGNDPEITARLQDRMAAELV